MGSALRCTASLELLCFKLAINWSVANSREAPLRGSKRLTIEP
jgi:hypothetical protein